MALEDVTLTNEVFFNKIASSPAVKKGFEEVIEGQILEDSLVRNKILATKEVSINDRNMQFDMENPNSHDIYYVVFQDQLRPGWAMSVNMRGDGNATIVRDKKFKVGFSAITTEHLAMTDEDALKTVHNYPKEFSQRLSFYFSMVEDREFILHLEAGLSTIAVAQGLTNEFSIANESVCFAAVKGSAVPATATDYTTYPITKTDMANLQKLFIGTQGTAYPASTMLITTYDWKDVALWNADEAGLNGVNETYRQGAPNKPLMGWKEVIQTNRTGIVRPGNVYAMSPKPLRGKFLIFMAPRSYTINYGSRIELWAKEIVGEYLGNLFAYKKLELFGAAVINRTTDHDGIGAVLPLSEDDLIKDTLDPKWVEPLI